MDRAYVFRSAALALALSLGLASGAPLAALAQEGSVVPGKPFVGKILSYDRVQQAVRFENPTYGTLFVAATKVLDVQKQFDEGRLKPGYWAKVVPNDEYKIVEIEWAEAPSNAGGGPTQGAQAAKNAAFFQGCKQGDKIFIELLTDAQGGGTECLFDKYFQGQVLYTIIGSNKQMVISLKAVRDARMITPGESGPTGGPSSLVPDVRPGEWYRVDDEYYGLCIRNVPGEFFVLELYPSGLKQTFSWATKHKIERADRPEIGAKPPTGGTGEVLPPLPNDVVVAATPPDPKQLDWSLNVYRVPAKIRHSFEGKILVKPTIEAGYQGDGTYLTPEAEKQALKQLGPLPMTEGVVWINDTKHYYERNDNGEVLIAELGGNATGYARYTAPAAIFPGVDVPLELLVNLRNAQSKDQPRVKYDSSNLVPFTDPRAVRILVKAYNDNEPALKDKVIGAFAKTGSKDVVPFLLYKLYLNDDPTSKEAGQLKQAIGAMRDSAGAEKYLIELIRDGTYKNEYTVPAPEGAAAPTEKLRAPGTPNLMLARIIELLELMQSDKAPRYVLPFVRSPDAALADAARNFFLRRGTAMVGPLAWLTLTQKDLAKGILREIANANPDAIWVWLRDVKQVKDPDHEAKRQGLPTEDVTELDLAYVIKWVEEHKRDEGDDDEIARAREVLSRIASARTEIGSLREALSVEYYKQTLGLTTADARPKKARLLQRAIMLNPYGPESNPRGNKEAQGALAQVYLEVASEMRQGAPLRSGPGDLHPMLRFLRVGETFTYLSPTELSSPEWAYVKAEDGALGWVHSSVLRDKEPGKTAGVNHARSPIKFALKYIELARALATDKQEKIESLFAEMMAMQADEASEAGDAEAAYEAWKVANKNAPDGRYAGKLFRAYLTARPAVPGFGLAALVAFLIAAFVHPKPPRVLSALPQPKRESDRDAEAPSGTRKVPS